MTHDSNKNKGCAWMLTFGLFVFILLVLLIQFTGLSFIPSAIISFFISLLITEKLLGKSNTAALLKNIAILFFIVLGLRFSLVTLLEILKSSMQEERRFQIEEGVGTSYILEAGDTITVYSSHRVWHDNYGNVFDGNLTVRQKDFLRLYHTLDGFHQKVTGNFWGSLYAYMAQTDGPSLDLVVSTFHQLQKERSLNRMEFAEMIISCIQDIPYSFVFPDECMSSENYEEAIRIVLDACPECCIGNKPYGIQNPVSFVQNLKGDCDTRTVLIYTLLKHFDYDVAIVNSDFYLHSVIGINLPANGLYKAYEGKKYYLWETTAKYYTIGQLPLNFSDVTHWNIVLTSK